MNLRQMQYLYLYGTKNQLTTIKNLADLAFNQIDQTKVDDLIGLIRWVTDYVDQSSYSVFFMEFCMSVDSGKEDFEVSAMDAIKLQEGYFGNDE